MNPRFDYHALAPELILTATIVAVLVADFFFRDRERFQTSRIATVGVLASLVPILTLAADGTTRTMFSGAYVVDDYALALKGFFLLVAYVTLLVSVDYIGEGDYYQGEYYFLLLSSVLGMVVMASARDLISIFVALELISVPTYVLAGWRKHDTKSNEAAIKYYLFGVLSSAVMLYGMSLIFGLSHFNKPVPFNWRYVIMAAIAGIFYGRAWLDRRRLASSALTHSTVDVVWSLWWR